MKPEELVKKLQNPKGEKILFKREYFLNPVAPEGSDQQLWNQLVEGQWQTLDRDIVALANGSIKTANKTGWLIIGADPSVEKDGERKIYDTSHIVLYEEQVLEKVNRFCEPPIQEIEIEQVEIEGKRLIVITVPKSPFVHENSQQMQLANGVFDETDGRLVEVEIGEVYSPWTVFLRRIEGVLPASDAERRKLIEEKSIQSPYKRFVRQIKENPVFSILSFILITALPTLWFLWNDVVPTLQPELMSGEFNVAVAEITIIDEDGASVKSKDGEVVGEFLYTRLESGFSELDLQDVRYEVWGPEQTGEVQGNTAEERSAAARQLAEKINAHVIVYGVITTGERSHFSPEFFVNYKGFEQYEDITGDHEIGSAMRITLPFDLTEMQVIENPALSARANALSLLTIGLAFLSVDDAEEALVYFQQAETIDGWFKSAGKEVIYLLIGNALGRQASIEKSDENLASASENYSTALEINPDYSRAKVGLASVLYLIALGDPKDRSFGSVDREMLDQAEALFKEASLDGNAPESANVSTKSVFGLGQIYFVKSQMLGDEWIEKAKIEFKKVTADYESGDERISETASHAYARLGLFAWNEGDTDTAVEFFRKGIAIASPYYQGFYYATIGDIYKSVKMKAEAADAYREAITIAEFFGDENSANQYNDKLKALE